MMHYELLDAVVAPASSYEGRISAASCLRALFEDSPVAIVALDSKHRFVMCNVAFESLFQFSTEELRRTDLDELITDTDTIAEAGALSRAVLHGEKVHTVARRRRKDGMMVDVEIHGIPLMVDGDLRGVYAVYQDLTERNRAQQAYLQLSAQVDKLQQEERRRVARDLHDSTAQELAALNWNISLLSRAVAEKCPELQPLVSQTKELAMQCSAQIRSATYLLHPPMLGDGGLYRVVYRIGAEFERRSGVSVTVEMPHDLGRFSDEVEVAVFRILQEALANVLRHSESQSVQLLLHRQDDVLTLIVSDEVKPTASRVGWQRDATVGVGISGMRERLEQLGGSLNVHWTEHGTTIVGMVPVGARRDV